MAIDPQVKAALDGLITQTQNEKTVIDGLKTILAGVPAQIQAAVDKATAAVHAGQDPTETLAEISQISGFLRDNTDAISQAVVVGTPADTNVPAPATSPAPAAPAAPAAPDGSATAPATPAPAPAPTGTDVAPAATTGTVAGQPDPTPATTGAGSGTASTSVDPNAPQGPELTPQAG